MSEYRLKTPKKAEDAVVGTYKKIEDTVVGAYKKVEETVVGAYQKVEDSVVGGYKKVEGYFFRKDRRAGKPQGVNAAFAVSIRSYQYL